MAAIDPNEVYLLYDDTLPPELYYQTPVGMFYAKTLERVNLRELVQTQRATPTTPPGYPTNLIETTTLQQLLNFKATGMSRPVFVKTTNSWTIAFTPPGRILFLPSRPTDEVVNVIEFRIPREVRSGMNRLPEDEPEVPFNRDIFKELTRLLNRQLPLTEFRLPQVRFPPVLPSMTPQLSFQSVPLETKRERLRESYETLLRQLYNLSVGTPETLLVEDIHANVVPYETIAEMLNQGKIAKVSVDPLLQPWAGPPSSPNRMVTFFATSGLTYVSKVRYDPIRNEIYPPERS